MHDLGITNDEMYPSPVETKDEDGKKKKSYPSFTLRNAQVKTVSEDCDVGDIVTATVKMKVTSRSEKYGSSLDFDILSMSDLNEPDDSSEEETNEKDDVMSED